MGRDLGPTCCSGSLRERGGHNPPPCALAGVFSIPWSNLKAQMSQMWFCTTPGGRGTRDRGNAQLEELSSSTFTG